MTEERQIIPYIKMHGLGNDYVYIDGWNFNCDSINLNKLAEKISDRHFGVGGDGLVCILPSAKYDVKMRMFNSDGSEAEMCGNAIRCIAGYCYENKKNRKEKFVIETKAGLIKVDVLPSGLIQANMGQPNFTLEDVPVHIPIALERKHNLIQQYPITTPHYEGKFTPLSMGNPHAVIFESDIENLKLSIIGPEIETHNFFPNRTNVEFVEIINRNEIKIRVWERGSGETLACGTGACAAVAAGIQFNRLDSRVCVHLLGGDLIIEYIEDNNQVRQEGPYSIVSEGQYFYSGSF